MGESEIVRVRKPLRTAKEPALVFQLGTEFKAAVPMIAGGKIKLDAGVKYTYKKGESTKNSEKLSFKLTVTIKPNCRKIVKARFYYYTLDVPFTLILKSGKKSVGVFRMSQYSKYDTHEETELLHPTDKQQPDYIS